MGHCQSDEHNGATIGRGDGRQKTCDNDEPIAHPAGIDSQILSILLTKEQGVEGFHQEQSPQESQNT